ncbi:hypothetical protein L6164_034192 [Bauhinia variegata]|uniref:Uncharacterized protein n=1 Tax=Bauhinia variegata TaxID=167791 RepID=A0ACB9KUM2_BAUVA|nr:hypothetical protein L6164_034192 [Bauhinia variegata]
MEITIQSEAKFNLEEEVAKVENAKQIISNSNLTDDQHVRTSKAKIQKVPAFLRERSKSREYYSPKLLSIGPIHHGKDNVKVGEQYKRKWTAMYLSRAKKEQQGDWRIIDEYTKIKDQIVNEVIKQCYGEDVIEEEHKENNYEPLAWMLFIDGCSVLEFMDKALQKQKELNIKIDQLILMHQDMLLLENQIPFKLLQLLCPEEKDLSNSMLHFLELHNMVPESAKIRHTLPISSQPTHLLDYLRNKILCDDVQTAIYVPRQQEKSRLCAALRNKRIDSLRKIAKEAAFYVLRKKKGKDKPLHAKKKNEWPRQRNIQELKAAGITVTTLEDENIRNIRFGSDCFFFGRLYLPQVIVDDSTAITYMNLIAYEMCPDFENDFAISSYLAFLDSLIDQKDDVKELRWAGILHNNLGSDEEVAGLFNTITTDLVPDPSAYSAVREKIGEHCKRRTKTWMAEFTYTHFQSPWSVLALVAAILVLGLTCVQTYYTIPHSK